MKMTKKLFLVAIATAAFALTSCDALLGMGAGGETFDKTEKDKEQGTKKDLTIGYRNNGNSKLYNRVWEQLGNKETVQAIETLIAIDTTKVTGKASPSADDPDIWVVDENGTKNTRAVVGLIFDLHQTKTREFTVTDAGKTQKVTKKLYDFVLIGYRPATKGFYVEKYTDVPEDAFAAASNDSSFSDAEGIGVEYLVSKTGKSTSATKFYMGNDDKGNIVADEIDVTTITERTGVLGKGEEEKVKARDTEVPLQEFTVYITQETPGTYNIKVFGQEFEYTPAKPEDEALAKKWYNNKGYRIGGAGYYVNVPVDTEVYANFNSKNNNTIGLEEEVDE